ncbi:hypothetical protein BJY01DRAFT_55661 [Aspergillus pseudoustus]|uniref:Uncharacterized protein n=1 Tax=Aspergillus pseudoustus TaxID=1810923 RepID=A0ABR4JAC4_9EURO
MRLPCRECRRRPSAQCPFWSAPIVVPSAKARNSISGILDQGRKPSRWHRGDYDDHQNDARCARYQWNLLPVILCDEGESGHFVNGDPGLSPVLVLNWQGMVTSGSHLVELFFLPRSMALDKFLGLFLPGFSTSVPGFCQTSHIGVRGTADIIITHQYNTPNYSRYESCPSPVFRYWALSLFPSGRGRAAAVRFHSDPHSRHLGWYFLAG